MVPVAGTSRRTSALVWGTWTFVVLLAVSGFVVVAASLGADRPLWGMRGVTGVWALTFGTVGAILASRRAGNAIGWLLLGAGLFAGLLHLGAEIALAPTADGRPRLATIEWLASWLWVPSMGCLAVAMLLFPTGRPKSPGWRHVVRATAVLTVGFAILAAVVPDFAGPTGVETPFSEPAAWVVAAAGVLAVGWQLTLVVALGSVGARWRGADAVTRLQLRWVAYAGAVVAGVALSVEVGYGLGLLGDAAYTTGTAVLSLVIPLIPIAIGIAILRYRLYEIDRIIGRTVVYGLVTATLLALYLLGVLLFQLVFTSRSGQLPNLVVAVTTLLVAAAFHPVRLRAQRIVDRRFNRRLADATVAIERFGDSLRRETDYATIDRRLRAIAAETVEPTHVSLWLPRG